MENENELKEFFEYILKIIQIQMIIEKIEKKQKEKIKCHTSKNFDYIYFKGKKIYKTNKYYFNQFRKGNNGQNSKFKTVKEAWR